MFCSNCGKRIQNNAKFCMYCGNPVNFIDDEEDIAEAVSNEENIVLKILFILKMTIIQTALTGTSVFRKCAKNSFQKTLKNIFYSMEHIPDWNFFMRV